MTIEVPKVPRLVEATNSDDPYDLARLRVSQNFLAETPTQKLTITVPIKRPGRQDFVRTHPLLTYRDQLAFLKFEDEGEVYVVDLLAVPELKGECYLATLFTAITSTGVVFLWPVRVPAADGKPLDWHLSQARAAEAAMTKWVRMKSNMSLRAYDVYVAADGSTIPDPEWPDLTFPEILRIALKDHPPINSLSHPVAKRLRGVS
jgi:hypothetical protein